LLLQLPAKGKLSRTYACNFKTYSRCYFRVCSFSSSASLVILPRIFFCFSLDIFIFSFSLIS
jgi:hypothetical protein